MKKLEILLASASPRRAEILSSLGIPFTVIRPDVDESSDVRDPEELTRELAFRKGREALRMLGGKCDGKLIISCDTVVYCDGEILGKPENDGDARRMLRLLSGKTHRVVSGICVLTDEKQLCAAESTDVCFGELSDADIEFMIETGEARDKAGAYAVQGLASMYIEGLRGDYFNVVGLPVNLLCRTLKDGFGIEMRTLIR